METASTLEPGTPIPGAPFYAGAGGLPETDQELLLQVSEKSRNALEMLYDRHSARALGIALQVLADRDLAEGVILDAYWGLWNNPHLARCESGDFSVWFYNLVRLMAHREQKRSINQSR